MLLEIPPFMKTTSRANVSPFFKSITCKLPFIGKEGNKTIKLMTMNNLFVCIQLKGKGGF